jgi:acyl-CoA thioester hydrolase
MRSPIDIELWVGHVGGASLLICYELFSPEGVEPRVLYTKAATTLVMVDAATGTPRRITDDLREILADYVEAPVEFTKR